MSRFSLKNISKSFAGNHILKDISLEVEAGEFIALVGPSGCGKSTLLRIVSGLESADTGTLTIGGEYITDKRAADRNVAMVFQSYALYPHLTAAQNIAVPLAMRSLSAVQRLPLIGPAVPGQRARCKDIQSHVLEMAKSLKIDHLLDRKPGQMSGGQRQRVALARAMVRRPNLFLMDEPLSNLDANLRVHARGEIVELHRKAGVPTLYVTHDQAEALSMADRVAVMISGNLLQLAPPNVIYDDPAHLEVAKFLGQPRINTLPAKVGLHNEVKFGHYTISLTGNLPYGIEVTLAIRPEYVTLSHAQDIGVAATVDRVEFLGSELIVYTHIDGRGEAVVAKLAPHEGRGLTKGTPVRVHIDASRLLVFDDKGARVAADAIEQAKSAELAYG